MRVEDLIEKGMIRREVVSKELIDKERKEAENDLVDAKYSFAHNHQKWTIVQSYYAIFHTARAFAYSKGYKEKSHYGLYLLLDNLSLKKELDRKYVDYFNAAMYARQDADYDAIYSKERAKEILEIAEIFVTLK